MPTPIASPLRNFVRSPLYDLQAKNTTGSKYITIEHLRQRKSYNGFAPVHLGGMSTSGLFFPDGTYRNSLANTQELLKVYSAAQFDYSIDARPEGGDYSGLPYPAASFSTGYYLNGVGKVPYRGTYPTKIWTHHDFTDYTTTPLSDITVSHLFSGYDPLAIWLTTGDTTSDLTLRVNSRILGRYPALWNWTTSVTSNTGTLYAQTLTSSGNPTQYRSMALSGLVSAPIASLVDRIKARNWVAYPSGGSGDKVGFTGEQWNEYNSYEIASGKANPASYTGALTPWSVSSYDASSYTQPSFKDNDFGGWGGGYTGNLCSFWYDSAAAISLPYGEGGASRNLFAQRCRFFVNRTYPFWIGVARIRTAYNTTATPNIFEIRFWKSGVLPAYLTVELPLPQEIAPTYGDYTNDGTSIGLGAVTFLVAGETPAAWQTRTGFTIVGNAPA